MVQQIDDYAAKPTHEWDDSSSDYGFIILIEVGFMIESSTQTPLKVAFNLHMPCMHWATRFPIFWC